MSDTPQRPSAEATDSPRPSSSDIPSMDENDLPQTGLRYENRFALDNCTLLTMNIGEISRNAT